MTGLGNQNALPVHIFLYLYKETPDKKNLIKVGSLGKQDFPLFPAYVVLTFDPYVSITCIRFLWLP